MKLYWSAASPYARKCRIVVRERGLEARVEEISVDAFTNPAELIAANPLGKVPALQRDGGTGLFDSRVICQFLDSLEGDAGLIPQAAEARLDVLRAEALADGLMDLAVSMSLERRKPEGEKSPTFVARWRSQLERGLDAMTAELPRSREFNLAHAAFASALGYIDYRQPGIDWRSTRKSLAQWLEDISQRQSLKETAPK